MSTLPFKGESNVDVVRFDHDPRPEPQWPIINVRYVDPQYFGAIGIEPLSGRLFAPNAYQLDSSVAVDCLLCGGTTNAVVLSEAAARALSDGPVIGRSVRVGSMKEPATVMGIVPDVVTNVGAKPAPIAYLPYAVQSPASIGIVLRGADVQEARAILPAVVASLDREVLVVSIGTIADIASTATAQRRYQVMVAILFSCVSIAMTLIGVYGIAEMSVARRSREVGIRLAMGAPRGTLTIATIRREMVPVAVGAVAGMSGALMAGRLLRAIFTDVPAADARTIIASTACMVLVSAIAAVLPVWRTVRRNPMSVLREL